MNLGVIGLGKLGLPFAHWLAYQGHAVYGVDKMPPLNWHPMGIGEK